MSASMTAAVEALKLLSEMSFSRFVASCCGGKGVAVWKNNMWECSDCGAAKSNDPSYLYREEVSDKTLASWEKPKCECGSTKLGSDMHSDYCPLYRKL